MTTFVDYETAKAKLIELALAEPDRKADCIYVMDGQPHCIAGRALFDWGVTVELLERADSALNDTYSLGIERLVASAHPCLADVCIDPDAASLLAVAQSVQDSGETWADAVELAIRNEER